MRISTGPRRSAAAETPSFIAASSVTSNGTAWACRRRSATFSSGSGRRPVTVMRAPLSERRVAIAAPMPVPPPVIRAWVPWRPSGLFSSPIVAPLCSSDLLRHLVCPLYEAFKLLLAGEVLLGPGHAIVTKFGGPVQSPVGIVEVWPGQSAQVGAAGGDDAVYVVGLEDI